MLFLVIKNIAYNIQDVNTFFDKIFLGGKDVKKAVPVYLYSMETQQEFFGTADLTYITKKNSGPIQAAAQKLLDDRAEQFYRLSLSGGVPLGTYLTTVLSIDFDKKITGVEAMVATFRDEKVSKEMLPDDLQFLVETEPSRRPADLLADLQGLYAVKCFLDRCIEEPLFFTTGSVQRLCSAVRGQSCIPQSLGLFAPIEIEDAPKLLIGDAFPDNQTVNAGTLSTIHFDVEQLYRTHFRRPLPPNLTEVYKTPNILDRVFASLFTLVQEGISVGKCGNCGKFFIPQGRAVYCDRIAPQDSTRTCKEYGSQRLWYDNLKKDEVAKLARTVYTAKQMLVRRNPDNEQYKALFDYFKIERKKWEAAVKAGKKTAEEYTEWLNIMRVHKTLEPTPGILPIPPALTED